MNEADKQYLQEATDIICLKKYNVITRGTYKYHGKSKACDLDFKQISSSSEDLVDIAKQIKASKKHYYVMKIEVLPYSKLNELINDVGFLDLNFKVIKSKSHEHNLKLISNLPDELQREIKDKYIDFMNSSNDKDKLVNFVKLKTFINRKHVPAWSLDEVINLEKKYYDEVLTIKKDNWEYMLISLIYKRFEISNALFNKNYVAPKGENNILIMSVSGKILYGDNKINYYYPYKAIAQAIKSISYRLFMLEPKYRYLINDIKRTNDEITKEKDIIGDVKAKICYLKIINNIAKIKINKYTELNKQDKIDKYNKIIEHNYKKIKVYSDELSKQCEVYYNKIYKKYKELMDKILILQ